MRSRARSLREAVCGAAVVACLLLASQVPVCVANGVEASSEFDEFNGVASSSHPHEAEYPPISTHHVGDHSIDVLFCIS